MMTRHGSVDRGTKVKKDLTPCYLKKRGGVRRIVLICCGLFILPLFAYTGFGGGKGLFRVQDAQTAEAGLSFGLHLIGRTPGVNDQKGYMLDLVAPEIHFTPFTTRYVSGEIFASTGAIFQITPSQDTESEIALPELKAGSRGMNAGAKISIPYLPVLKLGGRASYTFLFPEQAEWLAQPAVPIDTFSWTVLTSLRFQDLLPAVPNLLFNYGRSGSWTCYGAGLELTGEKLSAFAEISISQPANSNGIFDRNQGFIRLTPGITLGSPRGAAFSLGYTIGLSQPVSNELVAGFKIASPLFRKAQMAKGDLAGRVVDASSKQPIVATVEFPDKPKMKPLVTDGSGLFLIKKLPSGVMKVKVTAEGYHPLVTFVNIDPERKEPVVFEMNPLVTYGILAGVVNDAKTGKPLSAKITFAESGIEPVNSDPNTGAFRKDNIPVGTYTVTASADGYFPMTVTIQIDENRIANQPFGLNPVAVKSVVTGTVTDRGTGTPLPARVIFKEAGTGTVVTEVAADTTTGVYVAQVPVGVYAVSATAEKYIDQSTAVVVEEGKPTTYNFALVKVGTTVTLKGIYFDFNKATIKLPGSQEALQAAYQILKENPTIKVEIQGHTDNVGSNEYNQKLSEQRAQAVVNYLVQQMGVDPSRLIAKGYGESKPKVSNATPEGRAQNRRVEFVVIGEIGK